MVSPFTLIPPTAEPLMANKEEKGAVIMLTHILENNRANLLRSPIRSSKREAYFG
jgi:hypothetical protein